MRITAINPNTERPRFHPTIKSKAKAVQSEPKTLLNSQQHLVDRKRAQSIRTRKLTVINIYERRQIINLPNITCVQMDRKSQLSQQQLPKDFISFRSKPLKYISSDSQLCSNHSFEDTELFSKSKAVKSLLNLDQLIKHPCSLKLSKITGEPSKSNKTSVFIKLLNANRVGNKNKKREEQSVAGVSSNKQKNRSFLNNFLKTRYQTNKSSLRRLLVVTTREQQQAEVKRAPPEYKLLSPWQKPEDQFEDL